MLDNEMERVGRVLAADQGLRVRVQGASAYAKPGEVVIPNLETWGSLGQDAKRMLHGLLDHETGHAALSSFDVLYALDGDAKLIKRLGLDAAKIEKYKAILPSLNGAIEDGWMECEHGRKWPGAADNMARKNEWFWNVASKALPAAKDRIASADPIEAFQLAVTLITRKAKSYSDFAHVPAVAALLEQCKDLIDSVDDVRSSLAALHVSIAICERLDEQQDDSDESEGNGNGGKSDEEGEEESDEDPDGEDSLPGGDAAGAEKNTGEKQDKGDEASDEDDSEGTKDLGSKPSKLIEWKPSGAPISPEQAIEAMLHSVFDEPEDTRPYMVFSHDYDIECDLTNTEGSTKYLDGEVQHAVGALIQAFEAGLRARKAIHMVPGSDEGEVDCQMLAAFSVGAANVDEIFMQPVCEDDKNAAVTILVDCSGSMGRDNRSELAQQAAYAISQALSSVQVPHEVLGFTCVASGEEHSHPWLRTSGQTMQAQRGFAEMRKGLAEQEERGVPATSFARDVYWDNGLLVPTYGVFKGFDQTACNGLLSIDGIHENLDGEAVLWAAKRLRERPEPRRVMIVLSDGMPEGSRSNKQGERYLIESIARIVESGIEVHGIGIQTNAVQKFYPSNVVVNDLDHLCGEALSLLTEALITNRQDDA